MGLLCAIIQVFLKTATISEQYKLTRAPVLFNSTKCSRSWRFFFLNIKMSKGELPDDVVVLPSSHQMNEKKKLPDKKSILHESRRLRRNGVLSD